MSKFKVEERVEVYLSSDYWKQKGWFEGAVVSIEPCTKRRSFYWVKLDKPIKSKAGNPTQLISIINLKNIRSLVKKSRRGS